MTCGIIVHDHHHPPEWYVALLCMTIIILLNDMWHYCAWPSSSSWMTCGIIVHDHHHPPECKSQRIETKAQCALSKMLCRFQQWFVFPPWTDHYEINNSSPNHYASSTLLTYWAACTCTPVSHIIFTPTIWSVQGDTSLVSENYVVKIGRHVFLCPLKTIFLINFKSRRFFNRLESSGDRFQNSTRLLFDTVF